VDWCSAGPKNAIVKNMEIVHEPYENEFSSFQIMPTI
jgi:hypothetical protein